MHLYNNSQQIINFKTAASACLLFKISILQRPCHCEAYFFGGKLHEAGVDIDAENNEKLARKFVSEQESKNGSMQKKTKKLLMPELKQKKLELYFGIKCVSLLTCCLHYLWPFMTRLTFKGEEKSLSWPYQVAVKINLLLRRISNIAAPQESNLRTHYWEEWERIQAQLLARI